MPIIKSALKRMRQTIKRRARNLTGKRDLRSALKAFTTTKAAESLKEAQSAIDKAVKKKQLSKNTASRRKAHLAKVAKEAGVKLGNGKQSPSDTTPTAAKSVTKKASVKKPATKKASAKG